MAAFMAGAISTGHLAQRKSVERRSSARPDAAFAKMSAVAGATTINWARSANSMCAPKGKLFGSKLREATGLPVSAANVASPMNYRELRVITTETCADRWTSALVIAATLYAAIPPPTAMTISRSASGFDTTYSINKRSDHKARCFRGYLVGTSTAKTLIRNWRRSRLVLPLQAIHQ